MAKRKPFYVAHERGVTVPVYKYEQRKKGKSYAYYTIVDQSGDTRRLLTLSDPEDAKQKADSVAQAIRAGQPELVEYDAFKLDITNALDVLRPHGLKLLPAAQLLVSALSIVNANELLSACHYWKQRPGKPITPRPVKTAVAEFLARHKVSPRRQRTNTAYLAMFKEQFGERNVCDLQLLDIKDWAYAKSWKERTRNDVLGTVSLFFKDAIERGLAASNPASFKRKKVKGGTISTFAPEEAERILHGVGEDLRAFLAVIFFSGVRKEEAARLTWTQLNAARSSGAIYTSPRPGRAALCPSAPIWQHGSTAIINPPGCSCPNAGRTPTCSSKCASWTIWANISVGRPYRLAILLLAEIVSWYQPSFDPRTGRFKKKFRYDLLSLRRGWLKKRVNADKDSISTALTFLAEELHAIERIYRDQDGHRKKLFIRPVPEVIAQLSKPEEPDGDEAGSDSSTNYPSDDSGVAPIMGATSPPSRGPRGPERGVYSDNYFWGLATIINSRKSHLSFLTQPQLKLS